MLHEDIGKPERLFTPQEVQEIKRHFERDPNLRKINRGTAGTVRISYSIVKMENGRMFAMQDKLGEGQFGSVRVAQDIESGKWYALKLQKVDSADPLKSHKVNEIQKEEELQKKIDRFESRQVRLSPRETDSGTDYTLKFYTVMPLYEAKEAAKLTKKIRNDHYKLQTYFIEREVVDDELRGLKHIPFDDLSDSQKLEILDFITSRLNFGRTLSSELQILHDLNIIHRDLWPGNILVDKDSSATIIDFGKADYVDENSKTLKGILADGRIYSPESKKALQDARQKYGDLKAGGAEYVFSPQEDLYALGHALHWLRVTKAINMLHENLNWISKEERSTLLHLLRDLKKELKDLNNGRPSAARVAEELDKVYQLVNKKRDEIGLSSISSSSLSSISSSSLSSISSSSLSSISSSSLSSVSSSSLSSIPSEKSVSSSSLARSSSEASSSSFSDNSPPRSVAKPKKSEDTRPAPFIRQMKLAVEKVVGTKKEVVVDVKENKKDEHKLR
jgi:serine/threonine protein kinase